MRGLLEKCLRTILRKLRFDIVPYGVDDVDPTTLSIIDRVKPFTLTGSERIAALCNAITYISQHQIEGDIVECGVWKGGSMMAAAMTLLANNSSERTLWLFDTFEGMSEPDEKDVDLHGNSSAEMLASADKKNSAIWAYSPLQEVKRAMGSVGYDESHIRYIEGKVEDTLPENAPDKIALLRLDTDWYQSTYHELVHLYPRLSIGGVLIIDDYGHWQGARQAVDQYLKEQKEVILLHRVDYTARIAIKMA